MGPGGPYGDDDPNNPFGALSQPPSFWISLMCKSDNIVSHTQVCLFVFLKQSI